MQPSSSAFDSVYSRAYHGIYGGLGGSSADVCRLSRCPRTVDKTLVVCQYFHFIRPIFTQSQPTLQSRAVLIFPLSSRLWRLSFRYPAIISPVDMHQFACAHFPCVSWKQKTDRVQKSEQVPVSLFLNSGCEWASSICNHTFLVTLGLKVDARKAVFFFLSWIKRVLVNTPCNRSSKLEHIGLAVRVPSVQ